MELSSRIKRLVIILIIAIAIIFMSKFLLSKTIKNLSREAQKKPVAEIVRPITQVEPPAALEFTSMPAVSSSVETAVMSTDNSSSAVSEPSSSADTRN
jgi:hypothetical protein